jgi:DNA modification methylase
MKTNLLYYGDNLDILRRYIPDASVDLVYLDPPFNSNRDYPRIQLLSIRELLDEHRKPDLPPWKIATYQQAEKVDSLAAQQGKLFKPK